ncbi:methyltransferase, TIGR04325 family [Silvibacterium dinghuense]|nr:methyltransferase, TIGR04325 family [Silvibacterium dinghuense]
MAAVQRPVKVIATALRDLYAYATFHSESGAYHFRGVYPTYQAAHASIPESAKKSFDDPSVAEYFANTHLVFNPSDYPVLFWLNQLMHRDQTLFDFGGGIGQSFYVYQEHFLSIPDCFRWIVCDVHALAERGRLLARQRGESRIEFTEDVALCSGVDLFLTCGTLQYLEADLGMILSRIEQPPRHVLVNRVPVYEGEPYFTVQHSTHSYSPYKVFNRDLFLEQMKQAGYEKVEQWYLHRSMSIPFHPDKSVPFYHGFYFRRKD